MIKSLLSQTGTGVKARLRGVARKARHFAQAQKSLLERERELKRLRSLPRYTVFYSDLLGTEIQGPDAASFCYMYKELWLDEIYAFKTSKPNPLIIDCGANIGLSALFFKHLYPGSKVIAFEPDKKIFAHLEQNVRRFGFKDIELVPKAVWTEDTTLTFLSEGADGGRVQTAIDNKSLVQIEAVNLNQYLKEPVDFLKIDIEGAETAVLESIAPNLKHVENVFVEYHSFGHQAQTLERILKLFTDNGFRYHITIPAVLTKQPFMAVPLHHGMDLILNIFASKQLPIIWHETP